LQTSEMLQSRYGFAGPEDIRVLADERATTAGIKTRLAWLIDGSRPGDVLVFHYSGHGSQVRDRNGDELDDGLDEIICPYDLDWDDPFTDDDFAAIVADVPRGVSLTVLLDCCHSGTGLRVMPTPRQTRARVIPPPVDIAERSAPHLALRRFGQRVMASGAVLLAACRSDQTSADAWIERDYHGAFTYYWWKAVTDCGPTASYRDLARKVASELEATGYDQVPQVEGPRELLHLTPFSSLVAAVA
jgi:metacaspase-1